MDPAETTFNATRIASVRRMALDAARALLEESGAEAIQLRTIAARIGCGVSTLYHHFADKNALIAALAIEGFHDLAAAMAGAIASGDYARRVDGAGAGYIGFMAGNLRLYALMHSEGVLAANPQVREAERATFRAYQNTLVGDDRVPPDRVEELSLVGWAFGRGVASIILSEGDITPEAARALALRIFQGFDYLVSLRQANQARQR